MTDLMLSERRDSPPPSVHQVMEYSRLLPLKSLRNTNMRDAVTLTQRLSITPSSLATGITLEALKFVKGCLSISGNYCNMRDAVTLTQRLSITPSSLATGITLEALKFVKGCLSTGGNYCAGDAFSSRQTDENSMNDAHFCPHTL